MSVKDGKDIKAGSIGADALGDESVAPAELAALDADGIGPLFVIRKAFTAGTTGSADDVEVLAEAAFDFRIIDSFICVSTAKSANTVQLRSASGGGGSALSSAMSVGSTGRVRDASTASVTVSAEGAIYLRRSDRDCAGEVFLICAKS